jgi:type II secretory pathway predicted ATPase ExeA
MSLEETAAHVKHNMEEAKVQRPIFAESAVKMLHAASQGISRVVNRICSQAMFGRRARRQT